MSGITASVIFVLALFAVGLIVRNIADKLYDKWNPESQNPSNDYDDSTFDGSNYDSAPAATIEMDNSMLAVITAAAASVLNNSNIAVKTVTFVRNRPNSWADSGRQNIMSSHKTR